MIVRFKARALRHLEGIHRFISQRNPAAASAVVKRIEHSIGRLANYPGSGRPGVVEGTRLLVLICPTWSYRVREDSVDILAILHTARDQRG